MIWQYFAEDWLLYHKVIFDGPNKRIYISPGVTELSLKDDIYSSWKEWVRVRDNAKFLPAFRSVGGDPVGGGLFAGDIYFLINGWQIEVDTPITVAGILYHDDSLAPFIILPGGGVTSVVSNLAYAYNTTGQAAPPTVQEIRSEIDVNSAQLAAIKAKTDTITDPWLAVLADYIIAGTAGMIVSNIEAKTTTIDTKQDEIIDSISRIAISTSAINAPAIAFNLTTGIVTSGTYEDTKNLNSISHIISDDTGLLDIDYLFDIGINSAPATLSLTGKVDDKHEEVIVYAWNYVSLSWDVVGNIQGSSPGADLYTSHFTLFASHTGTLPGEIGDVKIRFTSVGISDVIITIDSMYISYAIVPSTIGYSAHAVSATSTTIQLDGTASPIDNYYVPSLLAVNHGTGAQQFAKVVGYTGATRTLQLELPMVTTLDTTSHISLLPWANATIAPASMTNIVSNVWGANIVPYTNTTQAGGRLAVTQSDNANIKQVSDTILAVVV